LASNVGFQASLFFEPYGVGWFPKKNKKTSKKRVGFSLMVQSRHFSGMNLDGNQLRHAKERPVKVVVRGDGWNFVRLLGFHWETSPTDLTCNLFRGYLGGWVSQDV